MKREERAYWDDPSHHSGGDLDRHNWMAHPLIRAALNEQLTGDADVWPTTWFARRFAESLPLPRVLSVGCGTGALERDLRQQNIAASVFGVDLEIGPVAVARANSSPGIHYVIGDATTILAQSTARFDAVFFHGSLHHFADPRQVLMATARALKHDGLLFVDEYVGRRMSAWRPWHLLRANLAYRLLPRRFRRPGIVRTPLNPDDPTEAVAADAIVPAIQESFEVLHRVDYGGLLWLLYANLKKPGEEGAASPEEFEQLIARLVRKEREEAGKAATLFSFIVARPSGGDKRRAS